MSGRGWGEIGSGEDVNGVDSVHGFLLRTVDLGRLVVQPSSGAVDLSRKRSKLAARINAPPRSNLSVTPSFG